MVIEAERYTNIQEGFVCIAGQKGGEGELARRGQKLT